MRQAFSGLPDVCWFVGHSRTILAPGGGSHAEITWGMARLKDRSRSPLSSGCRRAFIFDTEIGWGIVTYGRWWLFWDVFSFSYLFASLTIRNGRFGPFPSAAWNNSERDNSNLRNEHAYCTPVDLIYASSAFVTANSIALTSTSSSYNSTSLRWKGKIPDELPVCRSYPKQIDA